MNYLGEIHFNNQRIGLIDKTGHINYIGKCQPFTKNTLLQYYRNGPIEHFNNRELIS